MFSKIHNKKILITGGAGFIGSNLALKLLEKGCKVTVLDNLSYRIHQDFSSSYNSIKDKVSFIKGTVLSRKDWIRSLKGIDILVHLAAETGTGESMYRIEKYTDVNIHGTSILLDILANENINLEKMVIASSRALYGEGKYNCKDDGVVYPFARKDEDMSRGDFDVRCPICNKSVELLPTDEESRIHPNSIYGITKQTQEQMFLTTGESLKIPVVALRYQNIYGVGQALHNPYTGVISIFSSRIRKNLDINIFEDGKGNRDFIYIDDAVDATIIAIEKDEANYEVLNVGSGYPLSIIDMTKMLIKQYKSNSRILIQGNYRIGDIRSNFADLTKITKLLGFKPKVSFDEGIKKTSIWAASQEANTNMYDESINEMKTRKLFK